MGRKAAARRHQVVFKLGKDCGFFVVLLALWHPSTPDYVSLSLLSLPYIEVQLTHRSSLRALAPQASLLR